jgi:hypothetical protein
VVKVAEVIIGCLMGLLVTWLISRVWPMPTVEAKPEVQPVKA